MKGVNDTALTSMVVDKYFPTRSDYGLYLAVRMKGTWKLGHFLLLWINSPSSRMVSQLIQIGILRGDNNALVGWYRTMSCDPAISVGNWPRKISSFNANICVCRTKDRNKYFMHLPESPPILVMLTTLFCREPLNVNGQEAPIRRGAGQFQHLKIKT